MAKGVIEDEIMANLRWNVLNVLNLVIMHLDVKLKLFRKKTNRANFTEKREEETLLSPI